MRRLACWAALAIAAAWPASAAENLVAGLSQDAIQITSSYNGTDIAVFGAIEYPQSDAKYDVAVVVRGPDADMRVRRKGRVALVWINQDRAILRAMPSYYFIAATRPLAAIASSTTLRQYGLGLDALMPRAVTGPDDPEPFRQALIRREQKVGLYMQSSDAVKFLSGTLFRVRLKLPASAPRGQYRAEVYLFHAGRVIGVQSTPLSIDQTGLERRLFDFAYFDPIAYGLATVLMAVLLGWFSALVFRRIE